MTRKAKATAAEALTDVYFAASNIKTMKLAGVELPGLKERHPDAPEPAPYLFDAKQVRDVAVATRLGMNCLLTGPTGCGKTTLPIQIAARLGRPLVRFNCNGETRVAGLVGMQKPAARDGVLTLQFSHGALIKAMREGYWCVFDEIDAAPPSVLMVLQPVLEEGGAQIHIPETGEIVAKGRGLHPEFRIFATGNTLGYRAAARARHAGTQVMNAAFLDRFGLCIACDYPTRRDEVKRVAAHCPDVPSDIVDGLCRVAEKVRKDKAFRADFSTRRLIQWARLCAHYEMDVLVTLELAVARKLESATDAKVIREVTRRIFGYREDE